MISPTLGPSLSVARRGPHIGDCNESYADRHVEILYDRTWSMAAVHFEDWITRKRSLRPSLWESAYVGYQAVTSVTARTALGKVRSFDYIAADDCFRLIADVTPVKLKVLINVGSGAIDNCLRGVCVAVILYP